jgi:hypothetical protein
VDPPRRQSIRHAIGEAKKQGEIQERMDELNFIKKRPNPEQQVQTKTFGDLEFRTRLRGKQSDIRQAEPCYLDLYKNGQKLQPVEIILSCTPAARVCEVTIERFNIQCYTDDKKLIELERKVLQNLLLFYPSICGIFIDNRLMYRGVEVGYESIVSKLRLNSDGIHMQNAPRFVLRSIQSVG